jgi:hypothetical protein
MLDRTKDVQGVAVYAEFTRGTDGPTMMMFVTPDGYDSEGTPVPAALFRRIVSPTTPKKQWKCSTMAWNAISEREALLLEDGEKDVFAEARLRFSSALFDGLKSTVGAVEWRPVGDPVFVEVSKKDLDDVRVRKTPTKVVYRITQTRAAIAAAAPRVA